MTYPGKDGNPGQPVQQPTGDWAHQPPVPRTTVHQTPQPARYPGQPPLPGAIQYPLPTVPQPRQRGSVVISVLVAVLVLVGGGIGAWFAFGNASVEAGEATPQLAAAKLMSDLGKGDVLGLADDLPPGEASVLRDASNDTLDQLKRLNIVRPDVSDSQAYTLDVHSSGIQFDAAGLKTINDHLAINELVGGTITLSSDMWTNTATSSFLHAAFPNGVPQTSNTLDITKIVGQLGHPIGIATVKVNGSWYPSFYYSVVNAGLEAAHLSWPATSTPDVGAAAPDDAVRQFVDAAVAGDLTGVIERLDPNEMAALHDAGPALVGVAGPPQSSGVRIKSLTLADRPVTDGVDAVARVVVLSVDGDTFTVSQDNGCYSMRDEQAGASRQFCASDLTGGLRGGGFYESGLPPAIVKLGEDMVTGLMNTGVGIVTTQVDGQWYVSPSRTLTQLAVDVYGSVSPTDLAAALKELGHY